MPRIPSPPLVLALVSVLVSVLAPACARHSAAPDTTAGPPALFRDPSRTAQARAKDLVARMTLSEKIGQMVTDAPAIDRLGIPSYDWWSEGLHGVARAGTATVFPQAIGLAAMWDAPFLRQVATAVSDEARAKYHEAQRRGQRGRYQGLTFFSPNVNLFRDPRWGRGQETYGEDPFLTARLGVAFIQGMQGDDPRCLKLVATAKHFAVHSGPEAYRHAFDARVSEHDLRDSYLPQFEACVREGHVASVMPAYNRVGGQPCAASPRLLRSILRDEWGFGGYVVSDCGAIDDIYQGHRVAATAEHAAALAVAAGTDVNCGHTYLSLGGAVEQRLVGEDAIDQAVRRLFEARFRLGMFDPPGMCPYAQLPLSVNDSPSHRQLAKQAAQKSIVLLENRGGALPFGRGVRTIAVIGPTADNRDVLLGNYFGKPSRAVTILDGLRAKGEALGFSVRYTRGCNVTGRSDAGITDAVAAVRRDGVDAVVLVLGMSPRYEGEEGESSENPSGDRRDIGLPGVQQRLLEAVVATGKPTVLVLTGGSALDIGWAKAHIPAGAATGVGAILMAFYPGEEGGTAVADVLFGDYNPAGRLPVTFYASIADLPPFDDYAIDRRTYRYFRGQPLYAFGFGRSYTTFRYGGLVITPDAGEARGPFHVAVDVTNTGARAGDEVVELYVTDDAASGPVPIRSLAGFQRVTLAPGQRQTVTFTLGERELSFVDGAGRRLVEPGTFTIAAGGRQPDRDGAYDSDAGGVVGRLEVTGEAIEVK